MAGKGGRKSAPLSDQLVSAAHGFDFFQAVRLLEGLARERAAENPDAARYSVGQDRRPNQEVVRFRALPSLSFPAGAISQIHLNGTMDGADEPVPLAEMTVAFMGLTGPSGVLPQHYTSLVIERCHTAHKDNTLRDFFDLFNHRTISLFFRAWGKYRFQFAYERFRHESPSAEIDLLTSCLYCLVGLGTKGLRKRLAVDDETLLYYSGHFAHHPRSSVSLECLLSDHFDMKVELEQFHGRWLYLDDDVQSSLPCNKWPEGLNSSLGRSVIIGKKVWDVQSKFRIKVGPLSYSEFLRFIPSGNALRPLGDLARVYVGQEFTFDVQVVLKAAEVPACRIGGKAEPGSRLGWNTWLKSRPLAADVGDAVFRVEEN
jgi:type VI secretion system protein ImpH